MRFGGPCFGDCSDPDLWVAAMKRLGYRAAYCPVKSDDDAEIRAFAQAAERADIVIAEVGAFGNNPISPDDAIRRRGLATCQERLALAEEVGARCCVNVAGSRGERWAGPHDDNLTPATFDLIVESVRAIIDAVNPTRTYYTLETMPWIYPDSVESYAALLRAVDRRQFGVHLDPVNLVNSPAVYYDTGAMIRDAFAKLGPHIRSCHAKDTILLDALTVRIAECRPGTGNLDYAVFLKELDRLDPDTPLVLEHLKVEAEYMKAAEHIRAVARRVGVKIR